MGRLIIQAEGHLQDRGRGARARGAGVSLRAWQRMHALIGLVVPRWLLLRARFRARVVRGPSGSVRAFVAGVCVPFAFRSPRSRVPPNCR